VTDWPLGFATQTWVRSDETPSGLLNPYREPEITTGRGSGSCGERGLLQLGSEYS
jgi:hypothetical protein